MTRAAPSWKGVCVRVQGRLELVLCGVAGVEASCRWTWSSSCCSGVGMQGSSDAAFLVVGLVSLGLEAEMDGDFWRARSWASRLGTHCWRKASKGRETSGGLLLAECAGLPRLAWAGRQGWADLEGAGLLGERPLIGQRRLLGLLGWAASDGRS